MAVVVVVVGSSGGGSGSSGSSGGGSGSSGGISSSGSSSDIDTYFSSEKTRRCYEWLVFAERVESNRIHACMYMMYVRTSYSECMSERV